MKVHRLLIPVPIRTRCLGVIMLCSMTCACSAEGSGNGTDGTAGDGKSGSTSSAGASGTGSGGASSVGGSAGSIASGGVPTSGGTSSAGGTTNVGGMTGSGGATGTGGIAGGYSSSWIGLQAPDQAVTAGDLVPLVGSDCPEDPELNNGMVLFENSGTAQDALLFDWTHDYGGWHAATIGVASWGTLAVPTTDPNAKLVYWIKGEQGGEESAFTLGIGFKDGVNSGELWPPSVPAVTTSWQRVTIPLSTFGTVNNTSGVSGLRTGNSHSAQHAKYTIDNIYFTTGN